MISWLNDYDPLAHLLVQALLNSLWQGVVIVLLTLLLLRLTRSRTSATTRHAIWLVALLALALLPLVTALAPRSPRSVPAEAVVDAPVTRPDSFRTSIRTEARPEASTEAGTQTPVSDANVSVKRVETNSGASGLPEEIRFKPGVVPFPSPLRRSELRGLQQWFTQLFNARVRSGLVLLWFVICALMVARIIGSYFALVRLRRALQPLAEADAARLMRFADRFDLRRAVRIGVCEFVTMPLTIGWLRPLIVLPPDLMTHLSLAECESVVAHELAHIKRRDYLLNFLQRLVQAFLFFNPAVRVIGRQLAIERELACDDWAVKLTGEPCRYAGCLTRLAELLADSRPLAAAAGIIFGAHIVTRRVEMILNHQRNANTVVSRSAFASATAIALALIWLCSYFSPVIAVPQSPDRKATAQRKEVRPPVPPSAPIPATPATPARPEAVAERAAAPVVVGAPDAPLSPAAPGALVIDPDELTAPLLPAPVVASGRTIAPIAPIAPIAWIGQTPAPALVPTPAPENLLITGWPPREPGTPQAYALDSLMSRNSQPAIPESELLSVLTDIAKKDADPTVRSEALRGIYRLRSDASISSLLELYDAMSEHKVKSEIIGYLLRRKGDNSKALTKLVAIAKTEKDEELRREALRQLLVIKGDEGAANLIEVYDSRQETKVKQTVLRYLVANRSKKAMDKIMQIAKSDPDPAIRQMAIRSISGSDGQLFYELDNLTTRPAINGFSLGNGSFLGSGQSLRGGVSVDPGPLYLKRAELKARLKGLLASYSDTHPEVKAIRGQLDELDQEIERLEKK